MKRALTVSDLLNKKYKTLDLQGQWLEAFGTPQSTGVWMIWGDSGNGKTSFVVKLCKELSRFGRLIYNSLEEQDDMTMQNAFKNGGLGTGKSKILLVCESIEELNVRLAKHKSPEIVIIDSFQYTGLSYAKYKKFKEQHRNKLIIFISHAEGKKPMTRAAVSVQYDASLKIWVEGFVAFSKGRYIGENGGKYVIWEQGANEYHGEQLMSK